MDDSIKDESASESSSHDNISIVKDIDQLTHTCNEIENDADSIQVENIHDDLNLQESENDVDSIQVENIHDDLNLQESENVDYDEESNPDITESNSITTTVAIVTEYSEQDIGEEDISNTSVANSSNITETSQEDGNTDVASSFDGSFDGNNAVASLDNSHEEGSTTTDDNSITNSSDNVSRASSDVISNDDVIESSNDVTDAGLHRNVIKNESSKANKDSNSLPRKNKRSLISRLTKPSKSASKSEETELDISSKKVLARKGSFREKLQKKLFEEKSKKSSSSSIESSASPTKLSPSRAVVTPKAANKKSTFKSTKGIKKLGLLVGKQIFVASGAGKKEYKLVNAFSPPAVQASHFCVGLPMVRTPSKRRTVPHHAIGTVSNVLYMKRNQH